MPIIIDYNSELRPIPVKTLINRAGLVLQDEEHIRWTIAELIEWINEGVGAIIRLKPSAGARRGAFALKPGARQTLDGADIQLIDITCNLGPDDITPGRAVRKTDRHLLDSTNPDWQHMPPSMIVRHYTYDDRVPTQFYVYPPAATGARVELMRAVIPDDVANIEDDAGLSIEYADSLLNYVVFRCLSKDSEYAGAQMATGYYNAFTASMTGGEGGEQNATPSAQVPT